MNLFKGEKDDGEGKAYRQPFNWEAIADGLEQEASRVLNAVHIRDVVTFKYEGEGDFMPLINGRPSRALYNYAQHTTPNDLLELLSSNGRAVTIRREWGASADNPF